MWSSKPLFLATALLLVAGCGFQPVYAPSSSDSEATTSDLASVHVAPIADRAGQELREHLERLLAPDGVDGDYHYDLIVSLKETTDDVALERSGLGSRATVRMDATFVLTDRTNGEQTLSGYARSASSFNIGSSKYSFVVSEQDARSRTVQRIAADIRSRLSAYFARDAKS